MATPPTGFIEPKDRTSDQAAAHQTALAKMKAFTLAPVALPVGTKLMLTDFLDDPEVVTDMGLGFVFPGFHQLTGSCVGAAEGNAIATLSAVQRKIATNPTKAFCPWWPYPYGRTRYNEGDRGQGEGAVSSVMGATLEKEGVFAHNEVQGLPAWNTSDGLSLTKNIEYQWSDGGSNLVTQHIPLGQTHLLGARGPVYSTQDITTAIVNGYPVLNGCAYYVGNGSVRGSGDTAYVRGKYDGRGGHETGFYGVWNHPNDGMLFLYWNQWPVSTYPKDPAGGPRCSVWTPESEVARMLNAGWNGIEHGEAFAVSHVDYFPAQPDVINWATI
jgi:hypothetical protein